MFNAKIKNYYSIFKFILIDKKKKVFIAKSSHYTNKEFTRQDYY